MTIKESGDMRDVYESKNKLFLSLELNFFS